MTENKRHFLSNGWFPVQDTIYVYANGEKIDERKVKVLNIEEDMMGRDLLTFKYKGKKYRSYRVG